MDKPAGPTSHDVVSRVRRVLKTRAVGHTGTLDPFATGLLVVLVGRATRLARFVEQQGKTYLATARLGEVTTTDDLTGEVLAARAETPAPTRDQVQAALMALLGAQQQRPPAFSAKRVGGERSYAKARRGELLDLAEVEIVVHSAELIGYAYPEVAFRVTVGPGTYVRALARDLGERLGTGAHLTRLRREAIGPIRVEQGVPLDAIGAELLLPPLAVLGHLPRVEVTEEEARALAFGRAVRRDGGTAGRSTESDFPPSRLPDLPPPVAVTANGRLIAIARERNGLLQPDVVIEAVD